MLCTILLSLLRCPIIENLGAENPLFIQGCLSKTHGNLAYPCQSKTCESKGGEFWCRSSFDSDSCRVSCKGQETLSFHYPSARHERSTQKISYAIECMSNTNHSAYPRRNCIIVKEYDSTNVGTPLKTSYRNHAEYVGAYACHPLLSESAGGTLTFYPLREIPTGA